MKMHFTCLCNVKCASWKVGNHVWLTPHFHQHRPRTEPWGMTLTGIGTDPTHHRVLSRNPLRSESKTGLLAAFALSLERTREKRSASEPRQHFLCRRWVRRLRFLGTRSLTRSPTWSSVRVPWTETVATALLSYRPPCPVAANGRTACHRNRTGGRGHLKRNLLYRCPNHSTLQ